MSEKIIIHDYQQLANDVENHLLALSSLNWVTYDYRYHMSYVGTRAKPKPNDWFTRNFGEFLGPMGAEGICHFELWYVLYDKPFSDGTIGHVTINLHDEYDEKVLDAVAQYLRSRNFEVISKKVR